MTLVSPSATNAASPIRPTSPLTPATPNTPAKNTNIPTRKKATEARNTPMPAQPLR
ncbi:MAG: hypothetical protein HY075_10415 [Deltaproteobacteria bacterium]|nr:hypothetical protein [Deltaproteobacteria bacterium]